MAFLQQIKRFFDELIFGVSSHHQVSYSKEHAEDILNMIQRMPPSFYKDSTLWALLPYKQRSVKASILSLKNNSKEARNLFRLLYADELISLWNESFTTVSFASSIIVLAIPSSSYYRGLRDWDHMHELITRVAHTQELSSTMRYIPHAFTFRSSLTSSQHMRSKAERSTISHQLIFNEKALTGQDLYGACVIIIDDVTTTGATLWHARKLCEHAGATHIYCIALCH